MTASNSQGLGWPERSRFRTAWTTRARKTPQKARQHPPSYPAYCTTCETNLDSWAKRHYCIRQHRPAIRWGWQKINGTFRHDSYSSV